MSGVIDFAPFSMLVLVHTQIDKQYNVIQFIPSADPFIILKVLF